ncbi:MAG: hypothetical protein AAF467_04275 [Actinomycetota bacterium]
MTTTDTAPDLVARHYEPLVAAARARFTESAVVGAVTAGTGDRARMDRFLIWYCALGTQMTAPVEGWIARAGRRCVELGWEELGAALVRHAAHEAGHDALMASDTRALVTRWNRDERAALDAAALLAAPPTEGITQYIDLHEQTIAGTAPYAQIAIEYEIERLSVTVGPQVMATVAAVCGADRVALLTFLDHHIELDAGHTVFNRHQLARLLGDHPDAAPTLAAAGSAALDAYLQFLTDCWIAAAGTGPPSVGGRT